MTSWDCYHSATSVPWSFASLICSIRHGTRPQRLRSDIELFILVVRDLGDHIPRLLPHPSDLHRKISHLEAAAPPRLGVLVAQQ